VASGQKVAILDVAEFIRERRRDSFSLSRDQAVASMSWSADGKLLAIASLVKLPAIM